jgi:hypothetical protein
LRLLMNRWEIARLTALESPVPLIRKDRAVRVTDNYQPALGIQVVYRNVNMGWKKRALFRHCQRKLIMTMPSSERWLSLAVLRRG